MAVWGQSEGLRSGVPRAGEWNAVEEGTQEKVRAHRRSNTPLLGRARGGGVDCHKNLPARRCTGSQRAGHLWCKLWVTRSYLLGLVGDWALLVQASGGRAPLVWAKGSGGLGMTWYLLHNLQASETPTVAVVWEARGRHDLPPLGAYERAPPGAPVTSGLAKKKKKKRRNFNQAPKHHTLLLSILWEHTHQVPLPNSLGSTQTLDHCPFPRPYN